ncbi:MAG TPA: PAS domain S-box protein [Methanoregulaceae archaeon]|nr:PAS domain S-box protein [Methanoregulaceae archaeon]
MKVEGNIRRIAAVVAIPSFLIFIAILLVLHVPGSFEPPYVFLILNTIFTGLIPLAIAAIAFSSYRRSASFGILLIGVGMLVFGLACIVSPLTAGLPDGRNMNITIHNTGALGCATCQLFGGAVLLSGLAPRRKEGRALDIGAAYGIAVFLLVILIAATISGLMPVFLDPVIGYSVFRQVVIAGAIAFFGIASFLFALAYLKMSGEFLFWYAIGLGLLATGLLSAVAGLVAGDPFSWTARISQYFGCSFLLVAVIALSKEARRENIPIGDALSRFFGESREGYEMLVTGNPDAIIVVQSNRILFANDAALRLYGAKSLQELGRKSVLDLVDLNDRSRVGKKFERISSDPEFMVGEIRIVKLDGTLLDVAARAAPIRYDGGPAVLATLRDITDRKRVEEALRQKQAEIQALFDNTPAALALFDAAPPYMVLTHNRAYQELFNEPFRSRGMTGLNVYEYAPEVEAAEVVAVFDEVARTRTPKQFLDFPYRSDPPNERWFNWYMAPIVFDGKTISLVSMSLDVTAWHRAKEEVQKSRDELEARVQERTTELKIALETVGNERQRLYDVLESLPAMVCLLRPDYRIAFANRSFRDQFGESVVGKICYEVCYGNTDPCDFCESFKVLKTGLPHSWEVTAQDGTAMSAHDFPFTDTDGTKMILEMDIDITESRNMAEKIRQISAYNRNLIETSLDPLVTIKPDGKIGDVNEATVRVTGYSREELIGTDFSRYFTDPGQAEAGYLAVFRDGSVTDYALEIRHRDGRVIPVLYNASVFRDAQGCIAGVFAAARDITEQKKAQDELKKSHDLLEYRVRERTAEIARRNDDLAAAEEELKKNYEELARNERKIRDALAEKEVLLAEIHHRVKNNLSAFISLLSLEGSYDDTPAGIAMKNDLQNRARSMALIHETLYKTYQFSSVDMQVYLTTLVDQVVGSYNSRISVKASVHAEGVSLDLGRATPAGLIVNELVTNSLKYAFPADCGFRMPMIAVAMVRNDGKYFLRVKDNGIGLPKDFNVQSTKTLGIKLVNFLARHQMRATIEVNSSNGTEFVFIFADAQKNSGGS